MKQHKSATLKEYRNKRNFDVSPEPAGDSAVQKKPGDKLFFCVQKHLASHLHYDFRLEYKGVLLSWAVPKGPSLRPSDKRLAMRVEDHPYDYGEFEGVIPEGYGAGIVMLWDKGTWMAESPNIDAALAKGELKFSLNGFKLKGSWVLVRTSRNGDDRGWLLIKHRDEWAGDVDITEFAPLSIATQRDFPEILAAENPHIWHSHKPVSGGATGKMLQEIINKAVELKTGKTSIRKARASTTKVRSKAKSRTKNRRGAAKV